MNKLKILILAALCLLVSVNAQENLNRAFTFEEAVGGRMFSARGPGAVTWLKDGDGFSRIERNEATGGMDIVRYEASDNTRSVIVPSEKLMDKATGKAVEVYSFTWSADNSKILIFNNTVRVWRYNTKGDYWVLDIKSGELKQLNKGMEPSVTMYAKFNPDASKVAYVAKNNIYVEELATGKITALTTDGNDRFINGNFDWVYEEEFSCRDGFRWSSDGKYIAYWHSDTEGTGVFYMINNVDSIYAQLIPLPYPKSGTTNPSVKVGYVSVDGGATTWIDIPGDPRNNYIPRMEFIPGTNELFIQQMNRHQSVNKVWVVACGEKTPVNIFTDTDDAWTDPNNDIQWFRDNKYFTWLSDRDGYKHIFLVSRDGKEIIPVTKDKLDIVNIVGMDIANSLVYYITTPEGKYTQRYLYRSRFFGDGKMERVSPVGQEGTHSYNISPTGKWAIHTFNNTHTPPSSTMVSLPEHKAARTIVDNSDVKKDFDSWGFNYKEFVKADVGDYILDGWMVKPRHFDAGKKYPVIIDIYGEPASSTVTDTWQPSPWHQYLANQGYIIVSFDNRGQRVPRGREWRKSIYQRIGIETTDDQAKAIIELGKQYPFIDMERIGVTGWSGGGSMTLNCMFRYPDVYKTGIAVAFVAHQKLYNTIYQERYMRTPAENPEGYAYGSPLTHAKNLKGNLLLMHGTGDDNVHYQNCEMVIDELVKHQKLFQLMSYPMRAHGISEREGTSMHVRRVMDKFWRENLPAGGK